MKITNKQKRALEKISGKRWDTFSPQAIEVYFAFTDKGQIQSCDDNDFILLMEYHRQHPIIVEMWKEDFKTGLLWLSDFLSPDLPEVYIRHAFKIYESVMGYTPHCYINTYSV